MFSFVVLGPDVTRPGGYLLYLESGEACARVITHQKTYFGTKRRLCNVSMVVLFGRYKPFFIMALLEVCE